MARNRKFCFYTLFLALVDDTYRSRPVQPRRVSGHRNYGPKRRSFAPSPSLPALAFGSVRCYCILYQVGSTPMVARQDITFYLKTIYHALHRHQKNSNFLDFIDLVKDLNTLNPLLTPCHLPTLWLRRPNHALPSDARIY